MKLMNKLNERSFIFDLHLNSNSKKIIRDWGPYVVQLKQWDSFYVVDFECRDFSCNFLIPNV